MKSWIGKEIGKQGLFCAVIMNTGILKTVQKNNGQRERDYRGFGAETGVQTVLADIKRIFFPGYKNIAFFKTTLVVA